MKAEAFIFCYTLNWVHLRFSDNFCGLRFCLPLYSIADLTSLKILRVSLTRKILPLTALRALEPAPARHSKSKLFSALAYSRLSVFSFSF